MATLQSMRQAVLDARGGLWLRQQGYERVGILGTSIGLCTAFLLSRMTRHRCWYLQSRLDILLT